MHVHSRRGCPGATTTEAAEPLAVGPGAGEQVNPVADRPITERLPYQGPRGRRRRRRGWTNLRVALAPLVVLALLAAVELSCDIVARSWRELPGIESRAIGEVTNWGGLAWTEQGLITVGWDDDEPGRYQRYDESSARWVPLGISSEGICDAPDGLVDARPIGAGTVGGILRCGGTRPEVRLVSMQVRTGVAEPVLGPMRYWADEVAFAPGGSEALVAETGGDICASVRWVGPDGEDVRDVMVGDGARAWSLAAQFEVDDEAERLLAQIDDEDLPDFPDCEDAGGNARDPAWSSRDEVALFISPTAQVRRGLARIDAPYEIWLMDGDGGGGRTIATAIQYPHAAAWSPNGDCLAFSAQITGIDGLWLIGSDRDSVTLLRDGRHPAFAWNPTDAEMAVTASSNDGVVEVLSGAPLRDGCYAGTTTNPERRPG
jgi:hypothetical protein